MNTFEAIAQRRSIRKFKDTPVSDEIIIKILNATIQAPSGKNRQPWQFVVVKEDNRDKMVSLLRQGIDRVKQKEGDTGSSEWTANVMEQAPVTIFVFNPLAERNRKENFPNVVDVQSVGAAIQNMLLAATDLGLGTLWICDVFYAYDELCEWLEQSGQMIAAVSLGYADESPNARSRKPVEEVTTWL